MGALDQIVRSGRALYVGISSYSPEQTRQAASILKSLGTPCIIHQPVYNMHNRWIEDGLLEALSDVGMGCIPFSPLAQGMLTDKYLRGVPEDSRAGKQDGYTFLRPENLTDAMLEKTRKLNEHANARGQTLAQMALAWVLRHPQVCSALIGASRPAQVEDAVGALSNLHFSSEELGLIDGILA